MEKRNNILRIIAMGIFTIPGAIIGFFVMPFIIVNLSPKIGFLNGYKIMFGHLNYFIGGITIIIGFSMALWTLCIQVVKGLGTPFPILPPENLIVTGPYKYCRNPLVFGGILYYIGICFFLGTLSSFFIVLILILLFFLIIKFGEEPELKNRFKETYISYKQQTPFMIPKIYGKSWYYLFLR